MTTFSHIVCFHAKATVEPSSYFIQMLLCLRATSTVIDRIYPQNNAEEPFLSHAIFHHYILKIFIFLDNFFTYNGQPVFGIVYSKKYR